MAGIEAHAPWPRNDAIKRGDLVSLKDMNYEMLGVVVERGSNWLVIYVAGGWGRMYRFDHQVKRLCGSGLKK